MNTQTTAQDVSAPALIEFSRIKLWFFRDLVDAQRKALFLLCGFSDAVTHGELDTHSAQLRALRHTLRIDVARELQQALTTPQSSAPVVGDEMVAKAYRVCEDFIEEHGDGYINDLDDGQWNEMLRAALESALTGRG